MLNISECLLEFAINSVDTNSLRLKMATLSTLSACYWRQSKFLESINCMNLELKLASYLNSQSESHNQNNSNNSSMISNNTANEIYLSNIYRIYGNLASAYQRLNKLNECLYNFQMQLEVSYKMEETLLIINTNNSIGLAYNKLKDFQNSLEYFEKSLQLIEIYANEDEANRIMSKKLKLNQFNLIGECCLKLAMYEKVSYILNMN
jgi:tetratricopeptide (TPR) repeat protein